MKQSGIYIFRDIKRLHENTLANYQIDKEDMLNPKSFSNYKN
jgi:hypothetical protein